MFITFSNMFDKVKIWKLFEFELKSFKNKKNKFYFHKFRKLKVIYQIAPNYKCKPYMIISMTFEQVLKWTMFWIVI